nr:permease, cytosine/purine, uracil, thiamine, allantoin family [Raoultella sp. NCTC 9187]
MTKHQPVNVENLESNTIRPIPLNMRHGKPGDLFTIWFGSNIMLLTVITGAMSVTIFHLSFFWSVVALFIGSLVGGLFMALHSAQGPKLGVPQMVQTKGQFGSYGSVLVVSIVVLMYIGFTASSLVLGGQSMHAIYKPMNSDIGIIIVGALSLFATIFGYKIIHSYARIMSWISGIVLAATFVWIVLSTGCRSIFSIAAVSTRLGSSARSRLPHCGSWPTRPMSLTTHAICLTAPTTKASFTPATLAAY